MNQNRQLSDRLRELNVPVEPYTDNEKLVMKTGSASDKSFGKSGDGGGNSCGGGSGSDCALRGSVSGDNLSEDGVRGMLFLCLFPWISSLPIYPAVNQLAIKLLNQLAI